MDKNLLEQIQEIVDLHVCVQGEGRDTGVPAILIRMSGCNMNCQFKDWACDSAYTSWRPEGGRYSFSDIQTLAKENPQIKYAFITGGNPSQNPTLLQQIIDLLKESDLYVAIEDNGTLYSTYMGIDFVTLSPKLTNSVPQVGMPIKGVETQGEYVVKQSDHDRHEKYRTNYASMKKWITNFDYQLKFVISEPGQLEEVEHVISEIGADKNKVYLMPEGVTREQLNKRRQWLVELCIKKGYRFTDRLHIVTYDNKRES